MPGSYKKFSELSYSQKRRRLAVLRAPLRHIEEDTSDESTYDVNERLEGASETMEDNVEQCLFFFQCVKVVNIEISSLYIMKNFFFSMCFFFQCIKVVNIEIYIYI